MLTYDEQRDVRYRVYRSGDTVFKEICGLDGTPIHTLELPEGLKLDQGSYGLMLRYVLLDLIAA